MTEPKNLNMLGYHEKIKLFINIINDIEENMKNDGQELSAYLQRKRASFQVKLIGGGFLTYGGETWTDEEVRIENERIDREIAMIIERIKSFNIDEKTKIDFYIELVFSRRWKFPIEDNFK